MSHPRLETSFFLRDVLEVAPELLGKILVRRYDDGRIRRFVISETEAYHGTEDLACHASKGRTPRTEVMFRPGGFIYVYFVYGMYWMLNFVTGNEGNASAVLIRGLDGTHGPGKVGKILQLDRSFYAENLATSQRLWIENSDSSVSFTTHPRIGIRYAGEPWTSMPWRYILPKD
jgi:DNA-3-methyladenine glycosylase